MMNFQLKNGLSFAPVTVRKQKSFWLLSALLAATFSVAQLQAASVKDFGAKGDGSTDDTTAFRNAIAHAGKNNEPLHIPAGRYLIRNDIVVDHPIQFIGTGQASSIITAPGRTTRFFLRRSGASFKDLGFEKMIEPIALESRSGYVLQNLTFERCRFEEISVENPNRGVIGLSSSSSSQRVYRIRNLVVKDSIFRKIDAHAINIRGNISDTQVVNNQFRDIVSTAREGDSNWSLGGFAIRLGESSDDAGMKKEFATQGNHLIEGNLIRNLRKNTVGGNLIGMLIYGNYSTIRNNLIEDIDGTSNGLDTNAMYIRGAYNEILYNTVRNIRGADDDGAVAFKGGLDLGNQHNLVSRNLIENIHGMSAVESSGSHIQFFDNVIVNASTRGFYTRAGTGGVVKNNRFRDADTDLRTLRGEVIIENNLYQNSRIWISQRRSDPSNRDAVRIRNNVFQRTAGSDIRMVRLANEIDEKFVSVRNNRFEYLINLGDGNVVDLVANGTVRKVEIIGNHIEQNGSAKLGYRVSSSDQTVSGNTTKTNGNLKATSLEIHLVGVDADGSGGGDPGDGGGDPGDGDGEPAGLVAYYTFTEGSGNTAGDSSGFGSPLNLTLSGGAAWLSGQNAVVFNGDAAKLQSNGAATKLADQLSETGQFTLEVWARAHQLNQVGPARMVSYSNGTSQRNFMFSHGGDKGDPSSALSFRLRTTGVGDENGLPNIGASGTVVTALAHYVATFDGGTLRMYRDGQLVHSESRAGALTNWDRAFPLVLGNEVSGTRGWAGELHQVAIFDQRLSASEIQNRFNAGKDAGGPQLPPIVPPDLRLMRIGNPTMALNWTGSEDQTYQIQYSNALGSWSDHGEPILGDGTLITVTDLPPVQDRSRFYRLKVTRTAN